MAIKSITRISTHATDAVFSPDGTKMVFTSYASNPAPGTPNNISDIFVKNPATGAIERVSVDAAGMEGNGPSFHPVFSPDGGKVAFSSGTNESIDIFVKDLATGALQRVSTDAAGVEADGYSFQPMFSPDGGKVLFTSYASNLVPGDANGTCDVFVKDLATGAIARISTNAAGEEANSESYNAVFSSCGSKVAFNSYASNLVPGDTNGTWDIFVKDLATGAVARISTNSAGVESAWQESDVGDGGSYGPAFSPDGSKVAFYSYASNLVAGDTNGHSDIFVKDLATGAIARISTNAAGVQGNDGSFNPVFSPDGSQIAFSSFASTFVPGGTSGWSSIFVVELDDAWVAPPPVNWLIAPRSITVNETGGTMTFTISRSGSMLAQTVYVSTVENQGAANEGDFVSKLNEPVTFAFGELAKTVTVEILDDDIAEDDESFGLVVRQSPDSSTTTFLASATFTIEDNDTAEPVNQIIGTARNDRLIGTDGNDRIEGLAGGDWLFGGNGNDWLTGGNGNDWLYGEDGDDILIGGKGSDTLTGGRGADLFVIDALSPAQDMIFDFTPSEGDRLSLGPLIDSLGLRGESDVDALVGVVRVGQNIAITLDTNGMNRPGGVKEVALLFNSEITDLQQLLHYMSTEPFAVISEDMWV